MGRPPSSGGRIQWAKPIRPRSRSGSDETELRHRPWGQARKGRRGEAPELSWLRSLSCSGNRQELLGQPGLILDAQTGVAQAMMDTTSLMQHHPA